MLRFPRLMMVPSPSPDRRRRRPHRAPRAAWPAPALLLTLALAAPLALGQGRKPTPAPQIQVDKSKVDLAGHHLELRMSHPAASVQIRVLSESGEVLADETHDFSGRGAGAALLVTWSPNSPAPAARIELRATDIAGGFSSVALYSWSVSIAHEEVVFKTDSAEIMDSERPKLEASLQKITAALGAHKEAFGRPTLFIAGHTDTVGGDGHNLKLSQARAQSIARWFRGRGLRIPAAYEGFGEFALAVKTPDNTDEIRNRRADYILSIEEPVLKSTGSFRPSWKRLN